MNNASDKPRKALGKGLSSLIPTREAPREAVAEAPRDINTRPPGHVSHLPIEVIAPNPMQPRTVFDRNKLEELAASIRANGIIQPLIVRRVGDLFQIVAGERRWRAAQEAGLREVPVVLQDIAQPKLLEIALIENIQREDLGPMEIARAFERLANEHGMSQEQIAIRTGKDRATVANYLRLLKLPGRVQSLLEASRLSMGHAKALLGLPDEEMQIQTAERVAAQGLSVRQLEALVQEATASRPGQKSDRSKPAQDPNVRAAVDELTTALGTKVRIVELSDQRGRIEIEYYSQEQLDQLYHQLLGSR